MNATVLKVMSCDGKTLSPGDIVDVSGWRHTKNLVSNRYIKLVEEVETPLALPVDVKPLAIKKKAKVAQ